MGMRILPSSRASVAVDGVEQALERTPEGREVWSVSPRTTVLQIRSGEAIVEWAVLNDQVSWALGLIGQEAK